VKNMGSKAKSVLVVNEEEEKIPKYEKEKNESGGFSSVYLMEAQKRKSKRKK